MSAPAMALELPARLGRVPVRLHPVQGARSALVLVSGAGGGTRGPSGVYVDLAADLAAAGVTAVRMDYRRPNDLSACVADLEGLLDVLAQQAVDRVALVGWSFGGAVVITAGARSPIVAGVATIASQTAGTAAVGALAPRPLLIMHGTADTVLPASLAHDLFARAREPKELVLYPDDGHDLRRHRAEVRATLAAWSRARLTA